MPLVKQYKHLLSLDDVELIFEQSALDAAADIALSRGTGARGLRSIIESCLLDVMFEVPGREDIRKVVIDASVINASGKPKIFSVQGGEFHLSEDGTLIPAA